MDEWRSKRPCYLKNAYHHFNKRPRRFLELYRRLEEPSFHDAVILAHDAESGEWKQLKVHKSMLQVASDVFGAQFSSRWHSAEEAVIKLPEEYSVQAAAAFIKLLYLNFIDAGVCFETVLQVASLCDMYIIDEAMEVCNDFIITKIDKNNCLLTHEVYDLIQIGNPNLIVKTALKTITVNIYELIASPFAVEAWTEANWRTILSIESPYLYEEWGEYLELYLFQQLLRWRNAELARETTFQKNLLSLVRFPLMAPKTLADYVIPTGVLSEKDALDLFWFNNQSAKSEIVGNRNPRFPRFSRRQTFAQNSVELGYLLHFAAPYDNIVISPGDYSLSTPFELNQNKIKISGSGVLETRLICNGTEDLSHSEDFILIANTSDSLFTNLQLICNCLANTEGKKGGDDDKLLFSIEGSRNKISRIETYSCSIKISGSFNTVSSSILTYGDEAIRIKSGGQNVLSNLTISSAEYGVVLFSGHNVVHNINFRNTVTGIYARNTSFGEFKNISFNFAKKEKTTGIAIMGGSYNKISGLSCSPIPSGGDVMAATGIMLQGSGGENEVTDFFGRSLVVGIRIWEDNVRNIVKNFQTIGSFISIEINASQSNHGENVECRYSTGFLEDVTGVTALNIEGGKGNVFDNVQIVTQDDVLDNEENNQRISKFLQIPNLINGGEKNVIWFRHSSV